MYHCRIQFYLLGRDKALFDALRAIPPLDRFSHAFDQSASFDAALCSRADVIVASLRGTDAAAVLSAVLAAKRSEAELILAADREQLAGLIPFRFLRWQEGYRQGKELWEREQFLDAAMNGVPNLVWF